MHMEIYNNCQYVKNKIYATEMGLNREEKLVCLIIKYSIVVFSA